MQSGLAVIGGNLIGPDDPRIANYNQSVNGEIALYEFRQERGLQEKVTANHASKLANIAKVLIDSFYEEDDSSRAHDPQDKLFSMSLQRRTPETDTFASHYSYSRTLRILNADFGPDCSVGFQALHSLAKTWSSRTLEMVQDTKDPKPFGLCYSSDLLEYIFNRVAQNESPETKILEKQIEHQHNLISETDEEEDKVNGFDPAVAKLVAAIHYKEPDLLKNYDRDHILTILTIGKQILHNLGLAGRVDLPVGPEGNRLDPKLLAAANCKASNFADEKQPNFFPIRGESTSRAKAICNRCALTDQCLSFALTTSIKHGIWGGKSERDRRRMRREMATTSDVGGQNVGDELGSDETI